MIGFAALRDRFLEDIDAGGATPGLTAALEAIGWRSVMEPTSEELASYLFELVEACVTDHRDMGMLIDSVARLLRDFGPMLDGGLPPVAAYEPAAEEVLDRYVRAG